MLESDIISREFELQSRYYIYLFDTRERDEPPASGYIVRLQSFLLSSFFSSRFVSVHVVQPYSSIDVNAARKKLRFIKSWLATPHKTPTVRPPAPYHEKLFKLDEPDMQDTAGEAGTYS